MDSSTAAEVKTNDQETRQIQKVALLGFLLNCALTAIRGALAVLTGSLAITASTIDSATDSIASLILFAGLKLSAHKTPRFPLGLYKIENLLSVAIAFFIFFAGYEILRSAFSPAVNPPSISLTVILLVALGTLAVFLFGRYAIVMGRRTESPTLMAEGRHRQADVLSSVVVLISVVLSYFDLELALYGVTIDQIAAVLVILFIVHTGWELLSDGMRVLLDASIDHQTLSEVQKIIEAEPMVAQLQSLVGRNAGRFRFLQATVVMRTDDLQKAHQTTRKIESNIRERVPHVERVVIHYEPRVREHLRIAVPLADSQGRMSPHFGESPFFAIAVLRSRDGRIEDREILENPFRGMEKGKGIRVAEWLVEKQVDKLALAEDIKNKGPSYVFSDAGVDVQLVSAEDLEEALASVIEQNDPHH